MMDEQIEISGWTWLTHIIGRSFITVGVILGALTCGHFVATIALKTEWAVRMSERIGNLMLWN